MLRAKMEIYLSCVLQIKFCQKPLRNSKHYLIALSPVSAVYSTDRVAFYPFLSNHAELYNPFWPLTRQIVSRLL